jgi:hypothetical protein
MKIKVNCKQCNKVWIEYASNKRKFCSRKCFNIYWVNNISIANIKRGTGFKEYICKDCKVKFINFQSDNSQYCSRKCSDKHTLITREKVLGKNNPLWKGGITPINIQIRTSPEYKKWRQQVFERDNYICQICKIRGGNLRANHIKKFSDYPKLQIVLTNGITIHENCDIKLVMNHEEEWKKYFNNILKGGEK